MKRRIERVAVLGAGIMGSGITAHLANAGVSVLMLDIVPAELSEEDTTRGITRDQAAFRNRLALKGLEAIKKSKPPLLYSQKYLALIETGNFEDDWAKLAGCDWIVEAVVERPDVKQQVFERVEQVRRPGTIVSSNTSGIPLAMLSEGRSEEFRQHFLITHFFNPVRYMRLLEIVPGPDTLPEVVETMARFGTYRLGKGVVYAKDTPNFIANRIGSFSSAAKIRAMMEMDYQIDEVDVITGPATGGAKSATFGTADLVGLDTIANVTETLRKTVHDEAGDIWKLPDFITKMLKEGRLGRKSGAGFYKMVKAPDGSKQKLVLDWKTGEYRPAQKPRFASLGRALSTHDPAEKARILLTVKDRATEYYNRVTAETLAYASHRYGEIADSLTDIDNAMKWGFNAEAGPFEGWDLAGVTEMLALMKEKGIEPAPWVTEMVDSGVKSFYRITETGKQEYHPPTKHFVDVKRPADYLVLAEIKQRKGAVVFENAGASIVDIGDGVACVEFHSTVNPKLNPIDPGMGEALGKSLEIVPKDFRALVIHHQQQHFSAGANIYWLLEMSRAKRWSEIEASVRAFQEGLQASRRAPFPVVTAPFGMTLGGGAEIAMAGDRVCAHAELYMGQVEPGVGLVPGGCGHLRMLERVLDDLDQPLNSNLPFLRKAFEVIAMAKVSTSADNARELGFLRPIDHIEMNRDRQLWTAKRMAIALAEEGYRPPLPRTFQLPGRDGIATLQSLLHNMKLTHWISEHDMKIGMHIARVLCGGETTLANPVTEERILELEREAFLSLCGEPKTQERLEHMLKTNKPLRN